MENQFLDNAFNRESVCSNTSKSEYETEYDTEYEPDSSIQLDQSTCLSDDQFLEQEHLGEQLPSNNSAFIVYWSSVVLCCNTVYLALPKLLPTVCLSRDLF